MKAIRILLPIFVLGALCVLAVTAQDGKPKAKGKSEEPEPIRALLITGGCCHDYDMQKTILMTGISERIGTKKIKWSFVYEQFAGKDHQIGIYQRKDWARDFDVVVHNECYGGVTDNDFVNGIVKGHTDHGVGVVVLHCSVHSYRAAETDEWRNLIGVTSWNHGRKHPITVKKLNADHPVIAPVPDDWVTINGELYNTVASGHPDAKMGENATLLAEGSIPSTDGAQVCVWLNEYQGCKTFGTTIGHHNETMMDPVYLDLVTRGLLWTIGKLEE